jgi:hypothetical protein
MRYSDDSSSIIFSDYSKQEKSIPVSIVDFLMDISISEYEWQQIRHFHSMGQINAQNGTPVAADVKHVQDLVGKDLTGVYIAYWYANYEDSEWLFTGKALTVRETKDGSGYYELVFEQKYMDYWNDEGDEENYDEDFDIPYDVSRFLGMSFSGNDQFELSYPDDNDGEKRRHVNS